jgi:hypothetical protein
MITIETIETFNETLPSISVDTVEELVRRGLFHLTDDRCWRFGDESNGTTRRLDNPKWKRADTKGQDWHRLIGLSDVVHNNRLHVMLAIEGSKDALAAAELAHRFGFLPQVGIMCALGSGYRPIASELQQLRGRRVGVIGDNDAAGIKTTEIVCRALDDADVAYGVWDWSDLDGKDLYEAIAKLDAGAGGKVFPCFSDTEENAQIKKIPVPVLYHFSSLSPSQNSPIQPFNYRNCRGDWSHV